MSEDNGKPAVPQQPQVSAIPLREQEIMAQNVQLAQHINILNGQVQFLQNRVKELAPPLETPSYPNIAMPPDPVVDGSPATGTPRFSGEGQDERMPDPKTAVIPPPPEGMLRIMIAVPMLAVSYEFFESFLKFWTELCLQRSRKYEVCYHFAYRKPVHMAEEYLVKQAQFNKCTHILLMDDDIFDITVRDLNLLVDANKEFISGVMYASKFPHAMCVFRRYDTTKRVVDMPADTSMYRLYEIPALCPDCKTPQAHWDVKFCPSCGHNINITVQECDLVPFPFTLIDLKVFDKLKQPWFHCTNGYPTDSWFCDRLMEAGIKPHAHMLVRLNHAGITDETRPHFMNMGMARMQRSKAVVTISPDQMELHQQLLMGRMKQVEDSIKPKLAMVRNGRLETGELKQDMTLITTPRL